MDDSRELLVDAVADPLSVIGTSLPARPVDRDAPLVDEELFFKAWLREPVAIGAIMPTRAPLANAIAAAAVEITGAVANGSIIELGGGTGPVTRALLFRSPRPGSVAIVERHPVFYRLLTRRFPQARVLLGSAEELGAVLSPHSIGPVGAVISSLPRVGWPIERQRRILGQCFDLLGTKGAFLEFSYGPFSPVPRRLIHEFKCVAARHRYVWRNFPPATIWSYRLSS